MTQLTVNTNQSNAPPKKIQIGSGISQNAKNFEKKIGFLSKGQRNYVTELLFAGSFVSAIFLAMRAALMELFPKAFIGGLIRAKPSSQTQNNIVPFSRLSFVGGVPLLNTNSSSDDDDDGGDERPNLSSILQKISQGQAQFNVPVALDECFLELPEYFAMYFMPTIASVAALSRGIGGMLGLDFETLGQPIHEFEEHIRKDVTVGTLKEKTFKLTEEKLNRLALGKTMLTASVVALCGSLEYIVPSLRDFLTKWFLGYDDFSKLLGFKEELNDPEYANPEKRAAKNIKDGLLFALASVTGILGLTWLFSKNIKNPGVSKFFRRSSKHFDLGRGFQLSNTPLAIILLAFAIPGYMNALRGRDEKVEVLNRVILYSIPTIILYKQVVLNLLTYCSGLFFGLGKDLTGLLPKIKDQIAKGTRDPLDWNILGDFKYDKETKKYSGIVSKMSKLEKLRPERREAFLRSVGFINKLPLVLAPLIGMVINLFNLQKIFDMHQAEKKRLQQHVASSFQIATAT